VATHFSRHEQTLQYIIIQWILIFSWQFSADVATVFG